MKTSILTLAFVINQMHQSDLTRTRVLSSKSKATPPTSSSDPRVNGVYFDVIYHNLGTHGSWVVRIRIVTIADIHTRTRELTIAIRCASDLYFVAQKPVIL